MVSTRSQQQQRLNRKAAAANNAGGTLRQTAAVVAVVLFLMPRAQGFQAPTMRMSAGQDRSLSRAHMERRQALAEGALAAGILGLGLAPPAAQALVKGNAPPSDLRKAKAGGKPKTANMEDAMDLGRQKARSAVPQEQELFNKGDEDSGFATTKDGDRYRDVLVGSGGKLSDGITCAIRYRALRLGKRSRDGLSGEASTVFSFGYGEDDDKDGDVVEVTLGKSNLIPALTAGLVGMRVGGKRRILVRPERGWFKGEDCGALDSTDINNLAATFIVPGTKIDARDDCFDLSRVPSPTSYAARRRMGRRFDESLIVEVEVVR